MAESTTIQTPTIQPTAVTLRKELGVSGTLNYQGFLHGEEYNRNLRGTDGFKTYDIMSRSDGTVHAALQVCKYPLLAAHWVFKSPSNDPADVERTDYLNREFFDRKIDFYGVFEEGLTCLDFGYALGEIVYEPTKFNGKMMWGLAKLASRKQSTVLRWQTSTGIPGITQLSYGTVPDKPLAIDIPMQKLYVFTNEKRGDNYEGISLLRFAYKHWYLKDKLELMNAVALERMGLGIPYVKTGATNETTPDEEIAKVETMLRQIRVNEESYLKYPASLEVGMLAFDAKNTKDIMPTLEYEDTQIMLSVLAQFLGLGMGSRTGAQALSKDQSQLFLRALEAVGRTMARGFQSIANRLIDLNYSGDLPNGYPTLEFEDLDDDEVAVIASSLQQLVSAGVITVGLDVENRARRMLKIQELTQEDYDAKQAEKQAAAAQVKANMQPEDGTPPDDQDEPPVPDDDEEDDGDEAAVSKAKAKKKQNEDKLAAADKAVDELFSALAGELAEV